MKSRRGLFLLYDPPLLLLVQLLPGLKSTGPISDMPISEETTALGEVEKNPTIAIFRKGSRVHPFYCMNMPVNAKRTIMKQSLQ